MEYRPMAYPAMEAAVLEALKDGADRIVMDLDTIALLDTEALRGLILLLRREIDRRRGRPSVESDVFKLCLQPRSTTSFRCFRTKGNTMSLTARLLLSSVIATSLPTTAIAAGNETPPVYGNPADVVAIRQVVESRDWGVPHICKEWTTGRIVVNDGYALVDTTCDFNQEEFFVKRGALWVRSILGKPNVSPCRLQAKNVPHSVIVELYTRGETAPVQNLSPKAWIEKELKNNCPHF